MAKTKLFGIDFDALRMQEAVQVVLDWTNQSGDETRFVVTPNVDHTVLFHRRQDLRDAYANASLVVADGRPVVMASRWLGKRLPECVPGSDLVPAIFDASQESHGLRVFLLGAAPGVAQRAADKIHQRWPNVEVVGNYSPPLGFERNVDENRKIIQMVNDSGAHLLVIGLGAPKQELWINHHRQQVRVPAALCVGATIDFLAGERQRAPVWLRKISLEWLHRMLSEPRRLVPRYAMDAWVFPQLIIRQWWSGRRAPGV